MHRTTIAAILASSLVLQTTLSTIVFAQAPSAPPVSAAAAGTVIVPERTEIQVKLEEDLKSGANRVGEEVPFIVADDVYGPQHNLLIPAGTAAFGTVTKSSRRGMLGKPGKLEFTCDYIFMPDTTHVPLRSDPMGKNGYNNEGAVIATVALLSVFGLLINGRDVTVDKGQIFPMYVNANTEVQAPNSYGNPTSFGPGASNASPSTPAVSPAAQPAPAAPAAPGKSLLTMNSGTQVVCTILSFDGKTYQIQTSDGAQTTVSADDVKSIYALAAGK